MSRNLIPEPVETGSVETRIGQLRWRVTNSDVWGEVVQNLSQDFRCITLDIPLGSHTVPAR